MYPAVFVTFFFNMHKKVDALSILYPFPWSPISFIEQSETETLYEELFVYKTIEILTKEVRKVHKGSDVNKVKQPKRGERAREQIKKYEAAMKFEKTIACLKAQGLTQVEIADKVREYEYTEHCHFGDDSGYRRTKSMTDLRAGTGTSLGYSSYEWCGF